MFSWIFGGGGSNDQGNNASGSLPNSSGLGSPENPQSDGNAADISSLGSIAGAANIDLSKTDGRLDPDIFERIAKAAEVIKSSGILFIFPLCNCFVENLRLLTCH